MTLVGMKRRGGLTSGGSAPKATVEGLPATVAVVGSVGFDLSCVGLNHRGRPSQFRKMEPIERLDGVTAGNYASPIELEQAFGGNSALAQQIAKPKGELGATRKPLGRRLKEHCCELAHTRRVRS